MLPFTDLVLVEIDGQDVVTWHLAYDPNPQISYIIHNPGATDLAIVDTHGRIDQFDYNVSGDQIGVDFHKRSDYYGIIYRRRNYVAAQDGQHTYQDTWPFESQRYFAWFFPHRARILTFGPSDLEQHLQEWDDRPMLAQLSGGLTLEATYQLTNGTAGGPTAAAAPFDLDALLCDLAPPHGSEAEILCRHIAALPELSDLLGEATALRALLGQRLELNLAAPGTLALSENTPDEVSHLDRW
jgi:hypothetical protein